MCVFLYETLYRYKRRGEVLVINVISYGRWIQIYSSIRDTGEVSDITDTSKLVVVNVCRNRQFGDTTFQAIIQRLAVSTMMYYHNNTCYVFQSFESWKPCLSQFIKCLFGTKSEERKLHIGTLVVSQQIDGVQWKNKKIYHTHTWTQNAIVIPSPSKSGWILPGIRFRGMRAGGGDCSNRATDAILKLLTLIFSTVFTRWAVYDTNHVIYYNILY